MALRLLHPICRILQKKVYSLMPNKEFSAIMLSDYPVFDKKLAFVSEAKEMELVFETIKSLRNVRQSFNIAPSVKVNIEVRAEKSEKPIFESVTSYIKKLARVEEVTFADESAPTPKKSATAVVSASKVIIPLEELIDINAEISRQQKKLDKLLAEKNSLSGRLNNKKFVESAPKQVVEETQAKVEEFPLSRNYRKINRVIEGLKKELLFRSSFKKWARLDSNQRPKDYESSALPLRHKPMVFCLALLTSHKI